MTRPHGMIARELIWEAMVVRAEALHDCVVLSQARRPQRAVHKIRTLASELSALAHVAALFAANAKGAR
jgi:hypothetical protein